MRDHIEKLSEIVSQFPIDLEQISQQEFDNKPAPEKWSKKEIVGHLVDSAMNNIQRFVRVQYTDPGKFVYQQDEWVKFQNYQDSNRDELIDLWKLLNLQLVRIWKSIPVENLDLKCDIGKDQEQVLDLKQLAEDYNEHLYHHRRQIFV